MKNTSLHIFYTHKCIYHKDIVIALCMLYEAKIRAMTIFIGCLFLVRNEKRPFLEDKN